MDEILSRKNSEGYTDMTAYKAIMSADGFDYRPLVYICSPYSGNIEKNTDNARRYCRYAVDKGVIPMCPHLMFPQFMREDTERDLALFMDLVLLTKCTAIWVFGDTVTDGMRLEISRAEKRGQEVRFIEEEELSCMK